MIQGGDYENSNGTGGKSIYKNNQENTFEDESFEYKHDHKYLLSMANKGPNTNGSQFFILLDEASHLDNKHVVFGKVISGTEIIDKIGSVKVDDGHCPLKKVEITNCGVLVKAPKKQKRRHSSIEGEEAVGDKNGEEDKKKKKKKSKKSRKHSSGSESDNKEEGEASSDDGDDGEKLVFGDERPSWLDRGGGKASGSKVKEPIVSKNRTDSNGRIVKGRGRINYEQAPSALRDK